MSLELAEELAAEVSVELAVEPALELAVELAVELAALELAVEPAVELAALELAVANWKLVFWPFTVTVMLWLSLLRVVTSPQVICNWGIVTTMELHVMLSI